MTPEELLRKVQDKEIQYREYTPITGQRWDNLSWQLWGNPWNYELIKVLNPHLMGRSFLTDQDTVKIPILDIPKNPPAYAVPPWRQ